MSNIHKKRLAVSILLVIFALSTAAFAEDTISSTYRYEVRFENGINAENAQDEGGVRTLAQEGLSCGPYIDLLPGSYQVHVTGENLTGMTYDAVSDSGETAYTVFNPTLTDTELTFGFMLSKPTPRVEVRFFNHEEAPVVLKSCVIEEVETSDIMRFDASFEGGTHVINGEDIGGQRHLYEEGLSYGPYLDLIPGVYSVTITGTNLDWALPKFTAQYGAEAYTLYNLQTSPTQINYKIHIPVAATAVEITLYNPTPDTITIDGMTIVLQ